MQQNAYFSCIIDGHNSQPLEYFCSNPECKQPRLVCFKCMQQKHNLHNPEVFQLSDYISMLTERQNEWRQLKRELEKTEKTISQYLSQSLVVINRNIQLFDEWKKQEYLKKQSSIPKQFQLKSDGLLPFANYLIVQLSETASELVERLEKPFTLDSKVTKEINKITKHAIDKMKKQNYVEALKDIDKILQFDPLYCDAILLKSSCQLCLGKVKEALELAEYSVKLEPENDRALLGVAKIMMLEKKYKDALEKVENGLKVNPSNQYLTFLKLELLLLLCKGKEFEQYYEVQTQTIKEFPKIKEIAINFQQERLKQKSQVQSVIEETDKQNNSEITIINIDSQEKKEYSESQSNIKQEKDSNETQLEQSKQIFSPKVANENNPESTIFQSDSEVDKECSQHLLYQEKKADQNKTEYQITKTDC